MARERLGSADSVPPGEVRVMRCDGGRELAVSNIDGEFFAIDDVCTHDGGPLGEGALRRGNIICPRHGAGFDARTGAVRTLPAVHGVRAYALTVEGDDIYVQCDDDGAEGSS